MREQTQRGFSAIAEALKDADMGKKNSRKFYVGIKNMIKFHIFILKILGYEECFFM